MKTRGGKKTLPKPRKSEEHIQEILLTIACLELSPAMAEHLVHHLAVALKLSRSEGFCDCADLVFQHCAAVSLCAETAAGGGVQ